MHSPVVTAVSDHRQHLSTSYWVTRESIQVPDINAMSWNKWENHCCTSSWFNTILL